MIEQQLSDISDIITSTKNVEKSIRDFDTATRDQNSLLKDNKKAIQILLDGEDGTLKNLRDDIKTDQEALEKDQKEYDHGTSPIQC